MKYQALLPGNSITNFTSSLFSLLFFSLFYFSTPSIATAADTTKPSVPSGLNTTNVQATQMQLRWTASTDNVSVTGYRLDVSVNSSFSSFVSGYNNLSIGKVTSYVINGLNPGNKNYMSLRAFEAEGNKSNS